MRKIMLICLVAILAFPIRGQSDEMMLPEAQSMEIGDLTINYYETEGEGQAIFLLHGNSSSARSFLMQLDLLGDEYHVVAMDLPGHGLSSHAEDGSLVYNLPGYAGVVQAFAEELDITDAVFVGASLGGHILLEAADQLPDAKGIVIFGTPPVGYPLPADAFLPSPTLAFLFAPELSEDDINIWVSADFSPDYEDIPDSFYEDMAMTDGQERLNLGINVSTEDSYEDEIEIVTSLQTPLAIFHGIDDLVVNLEYIEQLDMPSLWREEVQIIDEAGHYAQWEQPEEFNSLLIDFINDVTESEES